MTGALVGLDRALASLLGRGTALAALLIALGLVMPPHVAPVAPERLVSAGVAFIVALPVARVVLMGLAFLRSGERDLAGAAGLVLAIIALASFIGAAGG